MNEKDIIYILSNTVSKKKNVYSKVPNVNTMRQYVSVSEKLGFNHDVGIGLGNQKALTLKRVDGTVIGELKDMKYPNNTKEAMKLVRNKFATEKLLMLSDIPTTNSKLYDEDSYQIASDDFFSKDSNHLVVIKPTNLSGGKGVNVQVNKDDFHYFWTDTVKTVKRSSKKKVNLLVQDYVEGFEARAVVIEGKLISIVARVPAYVVGNGRDNINGLVKIKNRNRARCAHLKRRPIVLDEKKEKFINYKGLTFESKPAKGEYVLLSSLSNIGNGGEMVDITYDVGEEVKDVALKSIAAIPGLYSGGVDIIMKDFHDTSPVVIEINAWPMLQSTIYPTYGKAHAPQENFLNSFFAIDQFLNNPNQSYLIENKEEYIRNFFEFSKLKNQLHMKQLLKSMDNQ